MKAGIVAIIGRSNVGKSTLLNRLVGEKVAIVSKVPQTTRNQIRAILNEKQGQIVFLDTPGMHIIRHALDRAMMTAINDALLGADVILHLVDTAKALGEEETLVMEKIARAKTPIVLGLNKIDLGAKYLKNYIRAWQEKLGDLKKISRRLKPVSFSALTGENLHILLKELFARLPHGRPLYPPDVLTDFPRRLTIQEIIREKLLGYLEEELPFSIAVAVEEVIDRRKNLMVVKANILVERPSQKGIVIGHGGKLLKNAGEASRRELEEIYEKKVYLELWVKVHRDWKKKPEVLRQIGYIL